MKKRNKPTKWHKLDNTANIFPVIANKRVTNVFRMTAVLKQEIDPALLQTALEQMLPYFAAFHVRLRHGLFWSYLETNHATPHIAPEEDAPCRYIDSVQTNRFLFRVLYFKNRVHLETFHALTDGTGALRFLKAICYRYCMLANPENFTPQQRQTPYGTENAANIEDGYLKNYVPTNAKTFKEPSAFHIRGERRILGDVCVVSALFSAAQLKQECAKNEVSIGIYLTAAIAFGIYEEYTCAHGNAKPINVFVPVDLRRMFNSQTSLNFFSNVTVGLPLHKAGVSFDEVLQNVKQQFETKCTKDALAQKLAFTARSENNIFARIIPLPVKTGILRIIFEHSNKGSTLPFSNLGPTKVQPEFESYFDGFRMLMSLTDKEPVKVTGISMGDAVAITFTTTLEENLLARNVIRRLVAAGVAVTVESNESEEGQDEVL